MWGWGPREDEAIKTRDQTTSSQHRRSCFERDDVMGRKGSEQSSLDEYGSAAPSHNPNLHEWKEKSSIRRQSIAHDTIHMT